MKAIYNIKNMLPLALLLTVSVSCQKDFLERKPLTEISDLDVWTDPALVEAYINDTYSNLDHGFEEVMLSSLTDESRFIHDYGTSNVVQGTISPDNHGASWRFADWTRFYRVIKNINLFFNKIDEVPFREEQEAWRQRLKGEAHFMRAYYYHSLVKFYGGVPIITKVFALDDTDSIMAVTRNTFEESVDFIVSECDKAIEMLPEEYGEADKGRATKYAAMALKSRMLLYAASDLYNQSGSNPLVGYVGGSQADRWQKAKEAAWAIINSGHFEIYQPTDSAAFNYSQLFLDKDNSEVIFSKYFDTELMGTGHDRFNGPNGYHNWGGNVPIQNFVDGYQMKDGSEFSWSNPAQADNPYKNRDPRFYATILYNGAKWKTRPSDAIEQDPVGLIQTGQYEVWNSTTNSIEKVWGLDTRNGYIENWNGTYSGYYLRKFMDINLDAQFFRGDQQWIYFRYSAILLNYAEACLELGQEAEARKYINMVRTRAGMPATVSSGSALMDVYRYERRYELAYEDHRYFDVRRWMQAEEMLNTPAKAIEIYGTLNPDKETHTWSYEVYEMQDRAFFEKNYFLPIPRGEIQKNSNIEQNPGY